ncbi:MAG: DUF3251 domain-containing protein [Thermomonas hydrothermalis]|nr:DUF3251 domain-containing protein [Thermomonas hydrothermalis]MCL6618580.1 DUF3251 domain-containing protein [Thermomonas hydrothermalis]
MTILLIAAFSAGCTSTQSSASSDSQLIAMKEELRAVKDQLSKLQEKQQQDDLNNLVKDLDGIAYLQPGDSGYSVVRYDLGTLTIQIADIAPYANGSKVALKLGNPLYSTVEGLKAKIEWGRVDENGFPDNESVKSKEVTLNESLRPGAWTTVPIFLDGIPPTDLGFVRIRDVSHTGIRLNR